MDLCTLAALITCFSWSNIYVDGGLQYTDTELWEMDVETGRYSTTSRNPLGVAAVGYEIDFNRWRFSLDLRHASSLNTGKDHGRNTLGFNVRYYPFK